MWPRLLASGGQHVLEEAIQGLCRRWDRSASDQERHSLPYRRPGRSSEEVERHSRSQSAAIPQEIAQLYLAIDGADLMASLFDGSMEPGIHEDFVLPSVWFFPLEDTYWAGAGGPDSPGSELVEGLREGWGEEESAWAESGLYVFGQTGSGVSLCYCESPPGGGSGKIVLAGGGEWLGPPDHLNVLILGNSLAEWLSRWMTHDFVELAYVTGELWEVPEDQWRPLCSAHLALNPGERAASKRLEEAEFSMLEQGELPLCIQHDPWWSHLRRQRVTMILFENGVLPALILFWPIVWFVFPMVHELDGGAGAAFVARIVWWAILGSFLLTLPLVLFQAIRVRRIVQEGAIVRGRCTSHGRSGVYWGKSLLEFTFEGESFEVSIAAWDSVLPKSGAEVALQVLPDDPRSFVLLQETGETDWDALNHLEDLTTRKDLYLFGFQTTDAGLVHLKDLDKLERLGLQHTKVTDSGLVNLKGLKNLTLLSLAYTEVSDRGLEHIEGLVKLSRLNLRDTEVTDAGLEHLKGLTNLEELSLWETKVTAEGIERLEQALPECKIEAAVRKATGK